MTLTFVQSSGSGTRANPTGGEDGDGRQPGTDDENEISSAVAFFYKANDDENINADAGTPITAAVSFENIEHSGDNLPNIEKIYTTETKSVDMEDGDYHVIVVANPGTTDWWTGQNLTLGAVRDHRQTTAWTENNESYSDFLMSSEKDATLKLESNSIDEPAVVEATVERMAARLDYATKGKYECLDQKYKDSWVEITGAALVNNLTAGSYLLKRVTNETDTETKIYLDDETVDNNGMGTNYVLDPWTLVKDAETTSFILPNQSSVTASGLYGVYYNNGSQDPNWWAKYVEEGTAMGDGFNRIGYTLENTTLADNTSKAYNTGVVFKAKFYPADGSVRGTYTDGATFFAWGTSLYASIEDIMTHLYGSNIFNDFDKSIEECNSWNDLSKFITSTLKENDPSGYYDFLKGQYEQYKNNENIAFDNVKESLYWKAYMKNVCGYSYENETVTLDQVGNISTREALKPYGVSTYEDATCYYTWWVRHCNDDSSGESSTTDDSDIDDGGNGVMEYAIVRNNIYKLTVESVYSLGGDVPGDNPLRVNVYVNDWLLLTTEELPM